MQKQDLEDLLNERASFLKDTMDAITIYKAAAREPEIYRTLDQTDPTFHFKIGQLVFVDSRALNRKIAIGQFRYEGPYVVTRIGKYNNLQIRKPKGEKVWIPFRHITRKVLDGRILPNELYQITEGMEESIAEAEAAAVPNAPVMLVRPEEEIQQDPEVQRVAYQLGRLIRATQDEQHAEEKKDTEVPEESAEQEEEKSSSRYMLRRRRRPGEYRETEIRGSKKTRRR